MAKPTKKRILLGISGGIAAYKSAQLVRLLVKQDHDIRVCMTQSAQAFISPLTLQALSSHSVHTLLMDDDAEAAMGHIELSRWADQIIIAPSTANTIARLAHGFADDLLSAICLATQTPIALAPSMNHQMWHHPATQANLELLKQRGVTVLSPNKGEQACGESGVGRMMEPEQIIQHLNTPRSEQLKGVNILITAGPTREKIDPVRFISNKSSGKMGYAIARSAQQLGANVTLISGPVSLDCPNNIQCIRVETAQEMLLACTQHIQSQSIFIATAAVADYTIATPATQKIKKSASSMTLFLTQNPDILKTISLNNPDLFTVGFAAETEHLASHAKRKLIHKKLNLIAANLVSEQKGFEVDENQLELFWENGHTSLPLANKQILAHNLMQHISHHYTNHNAKASL